MQSLPAISSTTRIFTGVIIGAYVAATVSIGILVRNRTGNASRFLHARASLPVFVTALAVLASNCGALEIVGIFASTARYGVAALHFYWLGAIPAILFLALFMMPIYLRSGAMTVPDLLRLRYNKATHILTCLALVTMMVFVAGISLYAMSSVLNSFFGWRFFNVVLTAAGIVLAYALLGGLRATIYSEVLQLTLTVAGLIPLAWMVHRDAHGFESAWAGLPYQMRHLWSGLPFAAPRSSTLDVFGSVFGLGFILASAYWCTDFVLIQRALAAKTEEGSINTPLLAAIPKMLFPILTVFPALTLTAMAARSSSFQFDLSLPMLMESHYGPYLLSLGFAAILASLMSGLAGNISAFSALMTHDLYRAYFRRDEADEHYLAVGRCFTAIAACLSVATAYIAVRYNNIMDYLQLILSLFNAPLFATFLLGMFTTWATPQAGFWGLLSGMSVALAHNLAVRGGTLTYGSQLLTDFYGAILGWGACLAVTTVVSIFTPSKPLAELAGLTYFTQPASRRRISGRSWALASFVLTLCVILNWICR
jgi:SSS family solute:Na+ symporter